ncbi:hypothetical protein [Leucobacter sp. USHLN153]|uniref:hypothetical protein n=1 Tax=Leucobacter sp. USHLN153 TaxID=3081268 RepID=UPI0030199156
MPYRPEPHEQTVDKVALAARIPGWGADRDPANRPSWPMEDEHYVATGPHWELPERQSGGEGRERSIEHTMLPRVFGSAQPLHGVSGAIRRLAYARFGEGKNVRWLLLVAGDRVEAAGAHLRSLATRRPDNPITQTGVLSEANHGPLRSRIGRGRVDLRHTWIDPVLVALPWLATGALVLRVLGGKRRG